MTVKELERIVHHEPFVPYQIVLRNGEIVTVNQARKSSVSGDQVALLGICRKHQAGPASERFRIIRIDQIAAADHVAEGYGKPRK